jgi:outer membrane protein OmpA-like peptidoglycan-associated protein
MKHLILLSIISLFFIACSPKSTVVLLDSQQAKNAILVQTNKGEAHLNEVGAYVDLVDKDSAPKEVKKMPKTEIKNRFSNALASEPIKPISYIVYFKFESTELTEASKAILQKALQTIQKRSPCSVDVIGHTDTVGSAKVNQKISLNRAKLIESIIKKQKMNSVSLTSKGFGEEDLLVPTSNNKPEPKNRNVEIFIK